MAGLGSIGGADPWLIAHARAHGGTVVIQESLAGSGALQVKIPYVCGYFGVPWTNTITKVRALDASF